MELLFEFYGTIYPKRVDFTIETNLEFKIQHMELGIECDTILEIKHSEIKIEVRGLQSKCVDQIVTIKNIIEENVRLVVDSYCFVNSYNYDLEISSVKCESIEYIREFDVIGEHNITKTSEEIELEFTDLIYFFSKQERMFIRYVLADFRRSIKYPSMTASFCFRSIETIRQNCFENKLNNDERTRRAQGWINLREAFDIKKADFDEIESFALPNRHGEYPLISYEQRERIMNFTRDIIAKTIIHLKK